jgi:hypothetical protein
MLEGFANTLTRPIKDRIAVAVFYKSLVAYFFLKMFLSRSVLTDIAGYHTFSNPRGSISSLLYSPVTWAIDNVTVFLRLSMVFLVWVLFVRPNYFMSLVVAATAMCFYFISYPVANGSDQVMISLLLFAIPLCAAPEITRNEKLMVMQSGLYQFSRAFCMIYICSVYFIAGLDKIASESWRSGEAIAYISKLRYMVAPGFADSFPTNAGVKMTLSWIVIVFELAFSILVWFKQTRRWILLFGVVFHLTIFFILSLSDFGLVMILSYLIFLTDEDYSWIRNKFKRGDNPPKPQSI